MRLSVGLFFLLISLHIVEDKRDYKIYLSKCDYSVRVSEILSNVNCSVQAHPQRPNEGALFGQLEMVNNITDFDFQLTFDMLRKDNTRINVISYQLNGCKFLKGAYSNGLIKTNLKEMRRVSNFPKKCPIIGNVRYKINGFTVNPDDYPPILPSLTFLCKVKFMLNSVYAGHFSLHGRVEKV